MRLIFSIVVSLVVFFLISQYAYAQDGTLTIRITNIKEVKGQVVISIYDKKENFPKEGKEYRKEVVNVDTTMVLYTYTNLPHGEYALAIFHDENSDGICNLNFFGIPKEGYGFSNNIKPTLSAPSFEKTKFKFEISKSLTIKLIH